MGYIQARADVEGIPVGWIPDSLLSLADPMTPSIRSYRERLGIEVVRMDRPELAGPSRRTQPERREPRTMDRGSRPARDAASMGALRVAVRGAGVGRVVGVSECAHLPLHTSTYEASPSGIAHIQSPPPSPQRDDTPPRDPSPPPQVEELTPDATQDYQVILVVDPPPAGNPSPGPPTPYPRLTLKLKVSPSKEKQKKPRPVTSRTPVSL